MIYVFWSSKSREEAKKIISLLLDEQLIACASILPEVESIYRWNGKIEERKEVKVILKTQSKLFDPICALICKHCSYEVPEIVSVSAEKCNPRYLSWVLEETRFT